MRKASCVVVVSLALVAGSVAGQQLAPAGAPKSAVAAQSVGLPIATDRARLPLAAALPDAATHARQQLRELENWNASHVPQQLGFRRLFAQPLPVTFASLWRVPDGLALHDGGELRAGEDGALWWSAQFEVADAFELRLYLTDVRLPAGARIWTTGDDGVPQGPVGVELLTDAGELWCPTVRGERVTFQVEIPAESVGGDYGFVVAGAGESFRFDAAGRPLTGKDRIVSNDVQAAAACTIDAMCESWVTNSSYARAIAWLKFYKSDGIQYGCTGGLLNDTSSDYASYLLTAHHCTLGTQSVANTLEAVWDYQNSWCNSWFSGDGGTTRGATALKTSSTSDYTLLLLSGTLPSGRTYLGWNASPHILTDGLVLKRIAHPEGAPLRYSTAALDLTPAYVCTSQWPNFLSSVPTSGQIIGQASGSPTMIDGGQVVGQLLGYCPKAADSSTCDYTAYDVIDGAFALTYPNICGWLDATGTATLITPSPDGTNSAASGSAYEVWWTDTSAGHTYDVQESLDPYFSSPVSYATTTSRRNFTHTVTGSTTYYYRVRARFTCPANNKTIYSSWSGAHSVTVNANCRTATTAPAVAIRPSAVTTGASYAVTWTASSPDNLYEIQESLSAAFASGAVVPVTGTFRWYAHAVTVPTTYYYRIRALQTCSSTYSKPWSMTAAVTIYPGTSVPLFSGIPVTAIDDAANGFRRFTITVPPRAKNLRIQTAGGTGDADLYVNYGSSVSTADYDYRGYLTGNAETITVAAPAAGTWSAGIHAYLSYSSVTLVATYELPGTPSDFNANGRSEILWRNTNGSFAMWEMNGRTLLNGANFTTLSDGNWKVLGFGDFNKDGKEDVFFRNAVTGGTAMWLMSGRIIATNAPSATVADMNWQMHAIGDFNGDGRDELIWRNSATGAVAMWEVNGTTLVNGAVFYTVADPQWQIVLAADFNGDGKDELLWRHNATGALAMWDLQGRTLLNGAIFATVSDLNWQIVASGDFNGDGKADLFWRHATTGGTAMWEMNHRTVVDGRATTTVSNLNWKVERCGDFDADGKDEILWRNAVTGDLAMWEVNGHTILNTAVFATVTDLNWKVQPRGGVRPALNSP